MDRNAKFLTIIFPLRDPFIFVESLKRSRLFTKYFFLYKSTWGLQKQTKHNLYVLSFFVAFTSLKWQYFLVSTTSEISKTAVPYLVFHSRYESHHWPYLVEMAQFSLQNRRFASTKRKSHLFFRNFFSANHNLPQPNLNGKGKNNSLIGVKVLGSNGLRKWPRLSIFIDTHTTLILTKAAWSSQLPTKKTGGLSILVQILAS